jgi:hypothetical protein
MLRQSRPRSLERLCLVVILEINIENIAFIAIFEPEGQPPIAVDRNGETPQSIPDESMKPANTAEIADTCRTVRRVEDQARAFVKLRPYPPRPPGAKDLFRTLVGKRLDRHWELKWTYRPTISLLLGRVFNVTCWVSLPER